MKDGVFGCPCTTATDTEGSRKAFRVSDTMMDEKHRDGLRSLASSFDPKIQGRDLERLSCPNCPIDWRKSCVRGPSDDPAEREVCGEEY